MLEVDGTPVHCLLIADRLGFRVKKGLYGSQHLKNQEPRNTTKSNDAKNLTQRFLGRRNTEWQLPMTGNRDSSGQDR